MIAHKFCLPVQFVRFFSLSRSKFTTVNARCSVGHFPHRPTGVRRRTNRRFHSNMSFTAFKYMNDDDKGTDGRSDGQQFLNTTTTTKIMSTKTFTWICYTILKLLTGSTIQLLFQLKGHLQMNVWTDRRTDGQTTRADG